MEAFQSHWPRIGFSDHLGKSLRTFIAKEIGSTFSFKTTRMVTTEWKEALKVSPSEGVFVLFGMHPIPQKGILEIDPLIAHLILDKLLGGTGSSPVTRRCLTEIEEGVLSYLILKIFSFIFEKCGESARVHFRLEGLRSSLEDIPGGNEGDQVIQMDYRISYQRRSGYARMILPSPFVQQAFLEPLLKDGVVEETVRDREYYQARLMNFGFVKAPLWFELGRSGLKAQDIHQLEPGDVLLLEKTEAHIEKGRLSGTLPVRVGQGETGSFRGKIISGEGPVTLSLEGMDLEVPNV